MGPCDCERNQDRMGGGTMSSFRKSLAVALAATLSLAAAGAAVVSAQSDWKAPAEAKNLKNPVKGVGNAKKSVETNCLSCHGASGKGDGPAAAALPPPKPADWTSARVQSQTDGEIFWKISNRSEEHTSELQSLA